MWTLSESAFGGWFRDDDFIRHKDAIILRFINPTHIVYNPRFVKRALILLTGNSNMVVVDIQRFYVISIFIFLYAV